MKSSKTIVNIAYGNNLSIQIGQGMPLALIAGPCAIEDRVLALETAHMLQEICAKLDIPLIYKSSFDKANRSSGKAFRGIGIDEGLDILQSIKDAFDLPVLTDVHTPEQVPLVASVVDVLQTPAFLCRQTDFIVACAQSGKPVNFKKGQFLAPQDMQQLINKAREAALEANVLDNFMVCERGSSFGYNNLIVDMRGLVIMRQTGAPVIFDATHSVQLPGAQGTSSGGQREFVPPLARSAVAAGVDGLFMETHPNPSIAKSDAPNLVPLKHMPALLECLLELNAVTKRFDYLEDSIQTW